MPGLVGAELEGHRRIRADAFGDPVVVDGQAVRDVVGLQLDLHQVVLVDLDPSRLERVAVRADDKRFGGRCLVLGEESRRGDGEEQNEVRGTNLTAG